MKILIVLILTILLITHSGCTGDSAVEDSFDILNSNVTIWRDRTGEHYIILAFEVSNISNSPLHFKRSDFDIIDEYGRVIHTMRSVNAYPPIVIPGSTAVYYDVIRSDIIAETNVNLEVIPHIEAERSTFREIQLGIVAAGGGGNTYYVGTLENFSFHRTYYDVNVVVISRTQSNEIITVKTTVITSIEPRQQVEFKAEDVLIQRLLGRITITQNQFFIYVDP